MADVTNKGGGTVSEGTGTIGTRVISKNYPVEEGLTAGTTKQTGRKMQLEATEGTFVPRRKRVGL